MPRHAVKRGRDVEPARPVLARGRAPPIGVRSRPRSTRRRRWTGSASWRATAGWTSCSSCWSCWTNSTDELWTNWTNWTSSTRAGRARVVETECPTSLDELVPDDEVLLDDVPESLTEACVAPGRTTSTAPATATLAKDAVTVAAVSRRLPCSRSASARASARARRCGRGRRVRSSRRQSSQLSMSTSVPRLAEGPVRARSENALSRPRRALLADTRTGIMGQCATTPPLAAFRAARDLLLNHREDYDAARAEFSWPDARRVQLGA